MGNLFTEDSMFGRFGMKIWELMVLNFLTVLCMLPIITAGASLTAMHYTLLKLHRDELTHVSTDFFRAFRREWKQATAIWLIYLAAAFLLGYDYLSVICPKMIESRLFEFLFYLTAFLILFSVTWVFILLSRYKKSSLQLIKDSFVIGSVYIIYTITMILLTLLPLFLLLRFPRVTPVVMLLGFSGTGYLETMLYSGVFDKCEGITAKDRKKPDELNMDCL